MRQDERKLEAVVAVIDARRALIEKRRLLGQPHKGRMVKLDVDLDPELIRKVEQIAADQGCTLSELLERLLELDARVELIKARRRKR